VRRSWLLLLLLLLLLLPWLRMVCWATCSTGHQRGALCLLDGVEEREGGLTEGSEEEEQGGNGVSGDRHDGIGLRSVLRGNGIGR